MKIDLQTLKKVGEWLQDHTDETARWQLIIFIGMVVLLTQQTLSEAGLVAVVFTVSVAVVVWAALRYATEGRYRLAKQNLEYVTHLLKNRDEQIQANVNELQRQRQVIRDYEKQFDEKQDPPG